LDESVDTFDECQGDQIGQVFSRKNRPMIRRNFSREKIGWATVWAIFLQKTSDHPDFGKLSSKSQLSSQDFRLLF
jgi:hypothetical protein